MSLYHFVYKTTCIVNNKFYYGVHSTDNLNDGYLGSGSLLRNAIKKYGESNFKREIIALFDTREEALYIESTIINEETLKDINCYNLCIGGGAPPIRYEASGNVLLKGNDRTSAQKQAAEEHSKRMQGRTPHNKGKKIDNYLGPICPVIIDGIHYSSQSEASKVHGGALSALRKKYNTNEFITISGRLKPKNIEYKRKRKPHSEETKLKIRNSLKARFQSGA
jgi:hypothetical protein